MHGLNGSFDIEDVKLARKKAENGKSPSDDEVLNEMLKKGGLRLLVSLTLLINILWALEMTPPPMEINHHIPGIQTIIYIRPQKLSAHLPPIEPF